MGTSIKLALNLLLFSLYLALITCPCIPLLFSPVLGSGGLLIFSIRNINTPQMIIFIMKGI